MPHVYNTSWMNETTDFLSLIEGLNQSLSGEGFLIGNLILFAFFLIVLSFGFRHDWLQVLMIDGFATTIIAILLAFAGIVSPVAFMFPALVFFITLIFYMFS